MWNWLVRDWHWPAAALFTAIWLLAIVPMFATAMGPLLLVYVQLPIYMLHQWEEHARDRFRLYVNRTIGGGREALTPANTFWINSLGVWGIDLAALYLAWLITPAAGLAAAYLALVNGITHVAQAIARREYHPGVGTAIILLIPFSVWGIWEIGSEAGVIPNLIGFGVAIVVHILIVSHVVRRLKHLTPVPIPVTNSP